MCTMYAIIRILFFGNAVQSSYSPSPNSSISHVSMRIAVKTDMNSPWTNKFSSSQQQFRCVLQVLKFSKHQLLLPSTIVEYNNNELLNLSVGKLDGLVFLGQADVQQGILFLRNDIYGKSNLHVLQKLLHSFFITLEHCLMFNLLP